MAQFFPSLEQVDLLSQAPTAGERHLLHTLNDILSDEYEVYFQSFINSLRPDVVIMRKGWGVIIIEVKDWSLPAYKVDEGNNWRLLSNGQRIGSPFQQVFCYRKKMFDLHIDGLAEEALRNHNFYNILKPFVYFHGAPKHELDQLFSPVEERIRENRNNLNQQIQQGTINRQAYEKRMDYWEGKSRNLSRDRGIALLGSNLHKKMTNPLNEHVLFKDKIYREFKRHLQPPFHTAEQGREMNLHGEQSKLAISRPGFQKIKGVAGSGKTSILARRAVNAFKRHKKRVLILTFNLSLKNYIHDRVSEVRENFPWDNFCITNYHTFVWEQRISAGVPFPENIDDRKVNFDDLFSNEEMFQGMEGKVHRYHSIFIDEAQDFERSWLKIIRKYFLCDGGEMVLFGDEGQNIYDRKVNKANAELIRGFGRWERLTKTFRSDGDSELTQTIRAFQSDYLVSKYDIDRIDKSKTHSLDLSDDEPGVLRNYKVAKCLDSEMLASFIWNFMKENDIHPNDLCILGSEICGLRNLDKAFRQLTNENTNTTFESQELYEFVVDRQEKKHQKKQCPTPYDSKLDSELEKILQDLRRSKKNQFRMNPGTLKISTIHSFKGLESQYALVLFKENETVEIAYTGITRARKHLITLTPERANLAPFFEKHLGSVNI